MKLELSGQAATHPLETRHMIGNDFMQEYMYVHHMTLSSLCSYANRF